MDVKTLLPGKHYQQRAAATASRANARQAKVNSEHIKHAQDCDAAVPGPAYENARNHASGPPAAHASEGA